MRTSYLVLAIVGAVVPYVFFTPLILEAAPIGVWLELMLANNASRGLTGDLLVSSVVFWVLVYREAKVHGMRRWWAYVLVNLGIGLSCALPLFLYVREGKATTAPDA